jgi:hypothetical protein
MLVYFLFCMELTFSLLGGSLDYRLQNWNDDRDVRCEDDSDRCYECVLSWMGK